MIHATDLLLYVLYCLCKLLVEYRVNKDPVSRFKKVENGNYAVMVSRDRVNISVVNCGGLDIVDGNKKIILGMSCHFC